MSDDDDSSSTPNHTDVETGAGGGPRDKPNEETKAATKKIVRVLTVLAYLSSVSMAAIMLSLYYIFIWNPTMPNHSARTLGPQDQAFYDYNSSAHQLQVELPPSIINPNNTYADREEPRALPVKNINVSSEQPEAEDKLNKSDNEQWQSQSVEEEKKKRFASTLLNLLSGS